LNDSFKPLPRPPTFHHGGRARNCAYTERMAFGPPFTRKRPGADRPDGRTVLLVLIFAGVALVMGAVLFVLMR